MSGGRPDGRDLPLIAWGDELRRRKTEASGRRRQTGPVLVLCGAVMLSAVRPLQPWLVWNATTSTPRGLYWVSSAGSLSRGDLVVARPPRSAAHLAAERDYLPLGVPLVKTVAAVPGDTICADQDGVSVDGKVIAGRLATDAQGRPLPQWLGCRTLGPDRYLLLNGGVARSFDGRYFGPSERSAIIGRARAIWLP